MSSSRSNSETQKSTGSFLVSIGIHVSIILVLASVIVIPGLKPPEAVIFQTPTIRKPDRIPPKEIEHQLRTQEKQQRGGRPTIPKYTVSQSVGSISLPEVKTTIKSTPIKHLSNLANFGNSGLGEGLGGGRGLGGLGIGTSEIRVWGIPERTERVAFLVDASKSMLEDQRGGAFGYEAVKRELTQVIQGLSEATFFNVIVFEKGVDVFQPKMVLANGEMKSSVEKWITPYNRDFKHEVFGTLQNNYTPKMSLQGARGGTTRMDLAIAAACEMGADTIFIISDGTPRVFRPLTPQEEAEKEKYRKELDKPDSPLRKQIERDRERIKEARKKLNDEREKRGVPPQIMEQENNGGGGGPNPKFNDDAVLKYLSDVVEKLYVEKKQKPPRVHVIGYETDTSSEQFLRALTSQNKGQFRRIKSLVKPIASN
jgi:hypothetical protein